MYVLSRHRKRVGRAANPFMFRASQGVRNMRTSKSNVSITVWLGTCPITCFDRHDDWNSVAKRPSKRRASEMLICLGSTHHDRSHGQVGTLLTLVFLPQAAYRLDRDTVATTWRIVGMWYLFVLRTVISAKSEPLRTWNRPAAFTA